MAAEPRRVSLKISHVGVVVRDLEASVRFWTETLGLVEIHRSDIHAEGVRTVMLGAATDPSPAFVELIEPIDKDDLSNPIARHLQRMGEGFYHLAVIDEDAAARAELLVSRGAAVIERPAAELGPALAGSVDADAPRHIVHPKCANGILLEVLQRAR